ncbi:hypothetical protein MMC22_003414, partial [Lobaria immixta]|nr:hypothetical protein [Lobaria immixta]
MDQTSDAPLSDISRLPNEILSIILSYTMITDGPVDLEYIMQMGRRLQDIRNGTDTENAEPSSLVGPERWILNSLVPWRREHLLDWFLINSTCCSSRACGRKAFFSEKIFELRPSFMKTLYRKTARISDEDRATALACISHVIAPVLSGAEAEIILLPRYHALQQLPHF